MADGHGGPRQGIEGRAYPNRSDLQLGVRQANPAIAEAAARRPAPSPAASLVPLDAPTQRPHEPVTAGAPIGAGPGPEVLGMLANPENDDLDLLRAMWRALPQPHEGLRRLIEDAERLL